MKNAWGVISQAALALLIAAVVGFAETSNTNKMPPPGTLNYVEGEVSVQGQKQTPKSVGSTYLEPNQVLDTENGNAEMLLTPGVFLRLGRNSEVRMISPGLADTQVQLNSGSAMLEVDQLFKENNVSVLMDGAMTQIQKQGLYDFGATPASVKVLDGKAVTLEGDQKVKLTKGHEVLLAESKLARQDFNKDEVENDPLYRWSKLRSEYSTQSNVSAANALVAYGGWWGPGWYWDPFWADFAFMPGMGMFWGPFGYPFFSPWAVGFAPYYGYGLGYGFYHYPAVRGNLPPLAHQPVRGAAGFRTFPRNMAANRMGAFRGGYTGGFHGRAVGGLRGAMGGFHGGFGGRR